MTRKIKMINKRFGYLTVLYENGRVGDNRLAYMCRCKCGKLKRFSGKSLRNGDSKSCNCKKSTHKLTHGMTKTRLHEIWIGMKKRCYNKNCKQYKWYGARGIKICENWNSSFIDFYKWSKENGYMENLELDRIDNDKGYSPENCRYVTTRENLLNRREIQSRNTSGYRGISRNESSFISKITVNYKAYHIGSFNKISDAVEARNNFIIKNNLQKEYRIQAVKAEDL